jgi:hypothetical protein
LKQKATSNACNAGQQTGFALEESLQLETQNGLLRGVAVFESVDGRAIRDFVPIECVSRLKKHSRGLFTVKVLQHPARLTKFLPHKTRNAAKEKINFSCCQFPAF